MCVWVPFGAAQASVRVRGYLCVRGRAYSHVFVCLLSAHVSFHSISLNAFLFFFLNKSLSHLMGAHPGGREFPLPPDYIERCVGADTSQTEQYQGSYGELLR